MFPKLQNRLSLHMGLTSAASQEKNIPEQGTRLILGNQDRPWILPSPAHNTPCLCSYSSRKALEAQPPG